MWQGLCLDCETLIGRERHCGYVISCLPLSNEHGDGADGAGYVDEEYGDVVLAG